MDGVSAEPSPQALNERTVLVSIMAANNEVGDVNPIAEIGKLCHDRGVVFHTDAAQAVGKIAVDVRARLRRPAQFVRTQNLRTERGSALLVRRRDPQVRLDRSSTGRARARRCGAGRRQCRSSWGWV